MSLKFSLAGLRNPRKPEDPVKYYARTQVRAEIGIDKIAEEISYSTTLTDGEVLNVLYALIHRMRVHLADGDMVSLSDFGKFQYQLSSEGATERDKFNQSMIRRVKLQFRPGKKLDTRTQKLQFEQVISKKALNKAKKQEEEEESF